MEGVLVVGVEGVVVDDHGRAAVVPAAAAELARLELEDLAGGVQGGVGGVAPGEGHYPQVALVVEGQAGGGGHGTAEVIDLVVRRTCVIAAQARSVEAQYPVVELVSYPQVAAGVEGQGARGSQVGAGDGHRRAG
ncbi:Uncharacterised protein [Acinetobacter baumannii]|nr:Uncharacterised protein [Acinetobacter baumannii]